MIAAFKQSYISHNYGRMLLLSNGNMFIDESKIPAPTSVDMSWQSLNTIISSLFFNRPIDRTVDYDPSIFTAVWRGTNDGSYVGQSIQFSDNIYGMDVTMTLSQTGTLGADSVIYSADIPPLVRGISTVEIVEPFTIYEINDYTSPIDVSIDEDPPNIRIIISFDKEVITSQIPNATNFTIRLDNYNYAIVGGSFIGNNMYQILATIVDASIGDSILTYTNTSAPFLTGSNSMPVRNFTVDLT